MFSKTLHTFLLNKFEYQEGIRLVIIQSFNTLIWN